MKDGTTSMDSFDDRSTEVALHQQVQEFRSLVEHSPDGIMRVDRQLRFLYVNPAIERQTGIPAVHFPGKTVDEVQFPQPLGTTWQKIITQAIEQYPEIGENQGFLQFGQQILHFRVVPETDRGGTVSSLLIVFHDITTLNLQATLALETRQEHPLNTITQSVCQSLELNQVLATTVHELRNLLQSDRVLIYRFNPDWSGEIITESVLPPWTALLNITLYDPCFTSDLIHAYQQGKINQLDNLNQIERAPCYKSFLMDLQVQANLVVPISYENYLWGLLCIHHCAAPHLWLSWEVDLVKQTADQLVIAIQQSELRQHIQLWIRALEIQVQERTAELQQAVEFEATLKRITDRVRDSLDEQQILEAVVQELGTALKLERCDTGIYDADQTTSTIAHEFTRSLPSTRGSTLEITSAPFPEVYPFLFRGKVVQFSNLNLSTLSFQQHFTILACPIRHEQQVLGDLWLFKPAGSIFTAIEVRLVEQVANHCAIALRQSRLYQSSQAQVQELERLNQLKDDFLSTVSHEMRTPMSNIKMATQMLEISLNRLGNFADEPSVKSYLRVLQKEAQREIDLINDLLHLTRLDAGVEPLNLTTISLRFYISSLAESFVEYTCQHQQRLLLQIPEDLPPLTIHLPYLNRILTELLHNACKYTPAGETITLSAHATPVVVEIQVSNSGVEIPAWEHDRIFDKFYRIPRHDPWKHGGIGLGLALVKKMVEHLGGKISVRSGAGLTHFILQLPLMPYQTAQ